MMRSKIRDFLNVNIYHDSPVYDVLEETKFSGYRRELITYKGNENDKIFAFLFWPSTPNSKAVLIHHQHNGERHLGKSEVAGIKGDPYQAFAPALAQRGFVVLAADSVCFEDRRPNKKGTEPDAGDKDFLQHFNEMTFRIVRGDKLMRKVLEDAGIGLSLLSHLPIVNAKQVGVLGHSYGGNTTLFQAAIDERVQFACASGAACTYRYKMSHDIPFEFALAIPGVFNHFDVDDLVKCVAPRKILLVSATEDKYSKDADEISQNAKDTFDSLNVPTNLLHKRYAGGHPLTEERHHFILDWISSI